MATEVSPEIIQSTQKLLGKHVTKPQLTEKLLNKPPFRFLHDVITVLVRNGFLKGLYSDLELNSENVKDRDAKIAFLNKLITAVKTLSGKDLQVKSSKIIAGLEAAETNRLLQVIAKLIDNKVDTRDYVKNAKKPAKKTETLTDNARTGATIKAASSKTSLTRDKVDGTRKKTEKKTTNKKGEDVSPKIKTTSTSKTKEDLNKNDKSIKVDKISSRTSVASKTTKNDKTSSSKNKTSPKTPSKPLVQNEENKCDRNDGTKESLENLPEMITQQEKTQDDLATVVIDNVDNSPRNDSWKPEIIENDDKLIEIPPSYQTLETNRIIDPENTFKLTIQEDHKPREAIRQPSARPKSAKPRSGNIDNRSVPVPVAAQSNANLFESSIEQPIIKPIIASKEISMTSAGNDKTMKEIKSNIILNTFPEKQDEKAPTPTPFRPKSSMLRPPSVRPSSARPGAPRLRPESSLPLKEVIPLGKINVIVENFDAKDANEENDEDETVVIQSMPNETQAENTIANKNMNLDIPVDKGHLVEQILEQMQDGADGGEKVQFDWEHEGNKSKDATTKEITALRASIQALTKTANPLGKLASYLHEDVEAMHSELEAWLSMKHQYIAEIAKQKRVNNESNQPLQMQLQSLEESIKHERDEISSVKYNILRNEQRIRHLVSKQITMD